MADSRSDKHSYQGQWKRPLRRHPCRPRSSRKRMIKLERRRATFRARDPVRIRWACYAGARRSARLGEAPTMSPTRATGSAAGDPGSLRGACQRSSTRMRRPNGSPTTIPPVRRDDARRPFGGADGPRGVASAATYRVYSCVGPDGRAGPDRGQSLRLAAERPLETERLPHQRLRRGQRDERVGAGQPASLTAPAAISGHLRAPRSSGST
jgi:hypothetical protein